MGAVRTMPAVLGFGAGLALIQGVFDYCGGGLEGYQKDPNVDEYERKERLRKERRRPIEETLRELGEGRGRAISYTASRSSSNNENCRNIWPRLRGETSGENKAEIWY